MTDPSPDRSPRDELAELTAMARELVEWEKTVSGFSAAGVPPVELPERPQAAQTAQAAPEAPQAAPEAHAAPSAPQTPEEAAADALPLEERRQRLAVLAEEAAACTACELHTGRSRGVFARGNPAAELVFVGEGPGFHEDQQGLPFVGRAGQLLDKMVAAMGYDRDEVYICNVVKCRPPNNRAPLPPERAACLPYLEAQIAVVRPKVIVALGRTAGVGLGIMDDETRGWRGQWRQWRGIPVMSTYHPAFLLRNENMKRPVWEDLQQVMRRLGREPPRGRRRG